MFSCALASMLSIESIRYLFIIDFVCSLFVFRTSLFVFINTILMFTFLKLVLLIRFYLFIFTKFDSIIDISKR